MSQSNNSSEAGESRDVFELSRLPKNNFHNKT